MNNETWLLEAGDEIIGRKAEHGWDSLSALDQLVYCFWAADYGARNAGDLSLAEDVMPGCLALGQRLAAELGLPLLAAAFGAPREEWERDYDERFDSLCQELRARF